MPAPRRSLAHLAVFFAKRNRLDIADLTLQNAVHAIEAAVRALPSYDQRKKNWSDQLIRWARRHGTARPRKPRPTAVESWLAKFGLVSGDWISIPRANLLRGELNASWMRYHSPASADNQMLWRHHPRAEVALMMTWHEDRTVEIGAVRIVHRRPREGADGLCRELCQGVPKRSQSEPGLRNNSERRSKRACAQSPYGESENAKRRGKDQ